MIDLHALLMNNFEHRVFSIKPTAAHRYARKITEFASVIGVVNLRLHNRFIHVGVDISSYALLIGGRSSYPPVLVKLLYPR